MKYIILLIGIAFVGCNERVERRILVDYPTKIDSIIDVKLLELVPEGGFQKLETEVYYPVIERETTMDNEVTLERYVDTTQYWADVLVSINGVEGKKVFVFDSKANYDWTFKK